MKIWNGYGSEHSANLVMIGHFKSTEDAEEVEKLFEKLTDGLSDKIDEGNTPGRFSDEVLALLQELNCNSLNSFELEQFLYDNSVSKDGDKIVITTEEHDISAFFKLMLSYGAKIEIFSRHDYPDAKFAQVK